MKKILIIQPHSDDALLSTLSLITEYGENVTILTVEQDEKRKKEDLRLTEIFGVKVDFIDSGIVDSSYYAYWKNHSEFREEDAYLCCLDAFGENKIVDLSSMLLEYVGNFKKNNPNAKIYAPLGVCHPFHFLVMEFLKEEATGFYRDFPHSFKRRGLRFMDSYIKERFKLVEEFDTQDIKQHKIDFFKAIYKTQSGLAWYEKGYFEKGLPEQIWKIKR